MYHHLARQLRKNMTDAEKAVWRRLRSKSFNGFRFRRQAAIGEYIADFVCFSPRVVLELDGGQHADQVEADEQRSAWFRSQGFVVLRYWNHQVAEDWDVIEQELYAALTRDEKTPHPNPPPQGGREPEPTAGEVR